MEFDAARPHDAGGAARQGWAARSKRRRTPGQSISVGLCSLVDRQPHSPRRQRAYRACRQQQSSMSSLAQTARSLGRPQNALAQRCTAHAARPWRPAVRRQQRTVVAQAAAAGGKVSSLEQARCRWSGCGPSSGAKAHTPPRPPLPHIRRVCSSNCPTAQVSPCRSRAW